jgi:hypothetical protein
MMGEPDLNKLMENERSVSPLILFENFDSSRARLIISDMITLLTVSDCKDEAALLTQDQNLIRVTKDYFDRPACCTKVHSEKTKKPLSLQHIDNPHPDKNLA